MAYSFLLYFIAYDISNNHCNSQQNSKILILKDVKNQSNIRILNENHIIT